MRFPSCPCIESVGVDRVSLLYSYEILNDANSREVYDRYGIDGLTKGGGGGGMDPNDMFAQFMAQSFSFGFGPERRPKGKDTTVPYEVTLEDLYNGKTVKMNLEKEAVCGTCQG